VFLLSALAGRLLGFTAMLPYITVLGLSVIAGFIVQGNFKSHFGLLAVATPQHRGATIGSYSCIGFGAAFLGALLFGYSHAGEGRREQRAHAEHQNASEQPITFAMTNCHRPSSSAGL
jgi:hypothetical protein